MQPLQIWGSHVSPRFSILLPPFACSPASSVASQRNRMHVRVNLTALFPRTRGPADICVLRMWRFTHPGEGALHVAACTLPKKPFFFPLVRTAFWQNSYTTRRGERSALLRARIRCAPGACHGTADGEMLHTPSHLRALSVSSCALQRCTFFGPVFAPMHRFHESRIPSDPPAIGFISRILFLFFLSLTLPFLSFFPCLFRPFFFFSRLPPLLLETNGKQISSPTSVRTFSPRHCPPRFSLLPSLCPLHPLHVSLPFPSLCFWRRPCSRPVFLSRAFCFGVRRRIAFLFTRISDMALGCSEAFVARTRATPCPRSGSLAASHRRLLSLPCCLDGAFASLRCGDPPICGVLCSPFCRRALVDRASLFSFPFPPSFVSSSSSPRWFDCPEGGESTDSARRPILFSSFFLASRFAHGSVRAQGASASLARAAAGAALSLSQTFAALGRCAFAPPFAIAPAQAELAEPPIRPHPNGAGFSVQRASK